MTPEALIARWRPSGGQESANYQLFLTELCDVLDVPHPDPAIEETRENAYVFERRVVFDNGDGTRASGWIDLYKRGCFALEAKQSSKPERQPSPVGACTRARQFKNARHARVRQIPDSLVVPGHARQVDEDRDAASRPARRRQARSPIGTTS